MNMENAGGINVTNLSEKELMCQIMKYDFAADELVLFLDTHPYDLKALEMHEAVVKKLNLLKNIYNEKFGPITSDDVKSTEKWTWINSPWPWENNQGECK